MRAALSTSSKTMFRSNSRLVKKQVSMNARRRQPLLIFCRWLSVCSIVLFHIGMAVEARGSSVCGLPCRNKGVCKSATGTRHYRNLESPQNDEAAEEEEELEQQDHSHRFLFQRGIPQCWCPSGFSGTLCEIEYAHCSSKEDKCFNGRHCQRAVDDFGQEFFHCGCDRSKSDLSLPAASKFCERVSTVFCNAEDDEDESAKKNLDPRQRSRGSYFCNNGGRCQYDVDEGQRNLGCECQAGFSGSHCEISNLPDNSNPASGMSAYDELQAAASLANPRRRLLLSVMVFLALLTCFGTAGYTFVVYRGQQQQQTRSRKTRSGKTAEERARIPRTNYRGLSVPVPQAKQSYAPVHEIEMT